MASEQLNELIARIHCGLRRTLKRGSFLSEPAMLELQSRLLSVEPAALAQRSVAESRFIAIDTETTGLSAYAGDEICAIALLEIEGLRLTGREFCSLVNPGREIPPEATKVHRITDADVHDAPVIEELLVDIAGFIGDGILIGHHVCFDIRFLNKILQRQLLCRLKHPWLDVMLLYLMKSGRRGCFELEHLAALNDVETLPRHEARNDALTAARIFLKFAELNPVRSTSVQQLVERQKHLRYS